MSGKEQLGGGGAGGKFQGSLTTDGEGESINPICEISNKNKISAN
jgi:hypothetical protein